MATYTNKYDLKKPAPSDFADVADLNNNMDIIDEVLDKKSNLTYCTCGTPASTSAKVATVTAGAFELKTGAPVDVKFTYSNTTNAPTLNVNGTGAKAIKKYGTLAPSAYMWQAGAIVRFIYDGTYWIMQNGTLATTTYYGVTKLNSSVNSTSSAEAATPSAVKQAYDLANAAIPGTQKAVANGVASLGADGKVSSEQIPDRIGKRTCRFVVGTSTAGWTEADCDYLCDGTADDVEINAAIKALPEDGGEIVILDGTYNLSSTVSISSSTKKITIRGLGSNTVLKRQVTSGNLISIFGDGVARFAIKDLQIDGNGEALSNNKSDLLSVSGLMPISVLNVIFKDTEGCCVTPLLQTRVENCVFDNVSKGIDMYGENCIVSNNWFISCSFVAVMVRRGLNTIANNIFKDCRYAIDIGNCSGVQITGNICVDSEDSAIYAVSLKNGLISNNICFRGTGLSTDYTSSQKNIILTQCSNTLVANNQIMGKNYMDDFGTNNTFVNNKYN